MSEQANLEQRVAELEQEVTRLKRRTAAEHGHWLERITGSMCVFPEFDDVVRLGREARGADTAEDAEE